MNVGWDYVEGKTCSLKIEKSASRTEGINQDDGVEYTLRYTNTGNVALTNVVVTDVLPDGVTFVAATLPPSGVTANPPSGKTHTYTVSSLAAHASGEIKISVTVDKFGAPTAENSCLTDRVATNTASVTANYENRTVKGDDSSATITVSAPKLSLTKTSDQQGKTLKAGDLITYTLTVKNDGGTAKGIVVADAVPAGTVFKSQSSAVADSSATGAFDAANNTWTFDQLLWSKTATITFTVKVTNAAAAQISNTASLTSTGCAKTSNEVVNDVKTCVPNADAKFKHGWDPTKATAWVKVEGDLPLCDTEPVTLVSYRMPNATSANWSTPQYLFDSDTKYFPKTKNAKVELKVKLPACFTQVDLFFGGQSNIINPMVDGGALYGDRKLGPSSSGPLGNRSAGPNTSNAWLGTKACGSTITIHKTTGDEPQAGVTFDAAVTGATGGGSSVTNNDGIASFGLKYDASEKATVTITENTPEGQVLESISCTTKTGTD